MLDEFLQLRLAEERAGLPGLEDFQATLESAGLEDQARRWTRAATRCASRRCGAAKGLEAPVVFLVDGGTAPFSEQHLPTADAVRHGGRLEGLVSWRSSKEVANGFRGPPRRVKGSG